MATKYGGYYTGAGYNAFRAVLVYETTSTSETSYTLKASVKCQMGDGHDSGSNFSATATVNGSSSSGTGSGYYSAGTTSGVIASKSLAISRTHTAQTITLSGSVKSTYAWSGKTSSTSATITVPAKSSYKVSFNANGGSGAPSAQTKWYGESLKLSTTKPTRTGHTFLGWATSSSASSATYAAGATYTSNSALSLYAVWKKNYVAPSISSGTAYRCNSNGIAEDEGTFVAGKVSWSVDTTQTNNKGDKLYIAYYDTSTSTYVNLQTITLNTTSGTTSYGAVQPQNSGFSTEQSYKIRFTITDTTTNSNNSATKIVTLSQAFFLIDALAQTSGKAIAFGRAVNSADSGKVIVGGPLKLQLEKSPIVSHGNSGTNAFYSATRTDTGQTLDFGIGSGGVNRGLWDTASNAWLLYADSNNNVNIKGITDDTWHTASYQSPFSNYGDLSENAPRYRKCGDVVNFYGRATVKAEQEDAVYTLFNLPAGYRPSYVGRYLGLMQGSGANKWLLSVATNGNVSVQRYGSTSNTTIPVNAWLTFSGTFII